MRTQEKLIYTNERGESIEFSPASSYHVNFKDVTGLSDVRNAIYSTNSMGQDGDTYLGYRIESRDIDIVGYIKERDKQAAQNLRRKLNRGGTITDAFRYLDVDSSYLQIAVGDNLFRYSADANAENLEVSIYHNNLYLGV